MTRLPDLSTLTREEAAALEQIAADAQSVFLNLAHNARQAMRGEPSERWLAEQQGELDDAVRLLAMARLFQRAAHLRTRKAVRASIQTQSVLREMVCEDR